MKAEGGGRKAEGGRRKAKPQAIGPTQSFILHPSYRPGWQSPPAGVEWRLCGMIHHSFANSRRDGSEALPAENVNRRRQT